MIATIDNIGGGVKLVDVNSEKDASANNNFQIYVSSSTSEPVSIPVQAYKEVSLARPTGTGSISISIKFMKKDGTITSATSYTASTSWTNISIPNNALVMTITSTVGAYRTLIYSLRA